MRNVITQNYGNGRLGMIDIASFNKALKSVWIRKYLDESNKGKSKRFSTVITTIARHNHAQMAFNTKSSHYSERYSRSHLDLL